jgi:hypothetical protein
VAEEMGYKVLVAEGSPIVLKIIVSGYVDAIVGVACLNVLEKAIDKILLAGIPCMAVPLLSSDCRNTSVDEDWVHEMIHVQPPPPRPQTDAELRPPDAGGGRHVRAGRTGPARAAASRRPRLAEANGEGVAGLDPIAATEAIAYDFLGKGGKHSRPSSRWPVRRADRRPRHATRRRGAPREIPDAVKRAAMSIETFHKASLVHDDIEDDDAYRYGAPTLHRKHGTPPRSTSATT